MVMLQVQRQTLVALAISLLASPAVRADDPTGGGSVIEVNGQKKGLYPIAAPVAPEGDAVAKQIAQVESFDMQVAGPFKVLDPASFLADTKAEGIGIEVQKWKDVGAYGVMKYKVSGSSIEFRLYEMSKGNTASLTKTYPLGKD